MTDADKLWQKALKSFGGPFEIDRVSLGEILEAYLEDLLESTPRPKSRRENILGNYLPDVKIPFHLVMAIRSKLQNSRPREIPTSRKSRTKKERRPPSSIREREKIESELRHGRKRKAELIAHGARPGTAHEKAANEVADRLGREGINIAASTLSNRLYGKTPK